ncbi:hypothetical protein [Rhizobium rhizogenes]|uniref:Uncharacterized protein n=1 Tax=Rhizobium rhizogenes TaxID=359 RepID=A0AA92BZA4_RHIRH|nr:hypothetical protein [Rhizobium rhizogenes]PVE50195.1 hypothetical protein DC430_22755 [Rhizobium rhizogenes]PVE62544.1 hypothetical protein DC415_21460 [Agrobacterium tumefaciens]PVE70682.1 hypothetical protein DCP16_21460 [Sphingomonas sp. TPD3009]
MVDQQSNQIMVITKDMLTNQLFRDGPRIAAAFDVLARGTLRECSEVLSMAQVMLIRHLRKGDDKGSEATCARLLYNAAHSYVAAVEVARKGYPRELGALMRIIVETIATVLAIALEGSATLEKFHNGKLETTKCIGVAKKALPFIGKLNGDLSNNFVHIGALHDTVNGARPYTQGDQSLDFVITTMKLMALLLDIVTEVIFATDIQEHRYWKREGEGWRFEPTEKTREWMDRFAPQAEASTSSAGTTVPDAPLGS